MKDKSKILTNELDILHNEVHIKDKLLQQVGVREVEPGGGECRGG
jgi:hypothetical protein